ncbi:MAG: Multi-sensor signal transduction histidine, partial [Mycobacterium sp.]|nr:Multi-sensor signal transduction histidine [Mycobacterium sp.]
AIKADGSVGPLTTDRVTADDRESEVGEKGDRRFEVANGDADVLKFDGHALHAIEPGRLAPVASRDSIEQAPGPLAAHRDGPPTLLFRAVRLRVVKPRASRNQPRPPR